jgi:hypothetical protein
MNYDDSADRKADECEMGLYGWVDVDNGVYNCRKCPIGTFSDTTTNVREWDDCQKCPIGTFGAERGATSIFGDGTTPACQPCAEGFYGDVPGQAICSPCPTYIMNDKDGRVTVASMVCGLGSVKPIWKNYTEMSDGYFHHWTSPESGRFFKEVSMGGSSFTLTELNMPYFVTGGAWMASAMAYACIYFIYLGVKLDLWEEAIWTAFKDFLTAKDYFEDDHKCQAIMEKVTHTKEDLTFFGGLTTVMFMLWAYALIGLTGFLYFYSNSLVEQSLVPKTEETTGHLRSDLKAGVHVHGYTGPCLLGKHIITDGGLKVGNPLIECNP